MPSDRFRWVSCQLEVLRQCFPSTVRSILAELPESLDKTYERILLQIPKSNRVYAHRLLQCLVVAVRPLTVEELAEVLAIDFSAKGGTPMVDEKLRWEDKEQAVLSACSTLIAVVEDPSSRSRSRSPSPPLPPLPPPSVSPSRRVQFSHFSVKEFLTSDRLAASTMDDLCYHHIRLELAHTIMAQACLGVLLRLDNNMDKETIDSYPLARYASEHFGDHVEFENVLSNVTDGVDDLLDPDKPHFEPWLWLQIGDWDPDRWHTSSTRNSYHPPPGTPYTIPVYPPRVTPLYYIAALGPLCLAHRLILKHPEDLHLRDNNGYIPLQIAVLAGQDDVSQLLIEYSADLDIQDIEGWTLLHVAAFKGLFKVAEMLLRPDGAVKKYVNARNKNGQTPLHLASQVVHSGILALLLKLGADVDAHNNDDMTPLHLASGQNTFDNARGTAAARLLLEHGASVHVRNKNGQTPLHLASQRHHSNIVALLLKFGADVDAHNDDNMTPLLLASGQNTFEDRGGTAAAQLLLEHGASVHVRNKNGQTPLHLASRYHHPGIVALLLKFGADADPYNNDNMTPLLLASGQDAFDDGGGTAAAQLLLEHGASVHVRNKNGETPLYLASHYHHSGIVALLLKFGADVDAHNDDNMTPLLLASAQYTFDGEGTAAVQLLLDHGASVHVRAKNGETPLHLASRRHDSNIVALLLKFGANVDAHNDDNMTPLLLALGQDTFYDGGGTAAAQLLLDHGASVHVRNKNGQTPLHLASQCCHSNMVALLLKFGADVDAQDNDNMTPLLLASGRDPYDDARATAAAQLLLEHGASVHVRNKNGQTPLHLASEHHHSGIVALLLKFGLDVDAQDNDNMTPLLLASGRDPYDDARATAAAQLLLDHGASVHVRNKNGQTPLHLASEHHHSGIVALLLKFGLDVDAQDNDNMTPLLLASGRDPYDDARATEAAQLLLDHGASVHVRNKNGQTPLHLASQHGLYGIVALLLKLGADMDAQDDDNMTPLHFAVHLSSEPDCFSYSSDESKYDRAVKVITLLLKHGVNVQVQNNNGETLLQVASGRGDQKPEVIRLLSEHMQND
jgi:ankyrin repeat protein